MSVFALAERVATIIKSEVNLVINAKQEAASLSKKLVKIQEGLQEAEREGVTNTTVKSWLKELEDVTYEMEDVLDEWETANLQVEVQDTSFKWDKVQSILCSCFNQAVDRREITLNMQASSAKIDKILAEKGTFTFVSGVNDRAHEFNQGESTSLVDDEFKTYGLEVVKKSLLEKLDLEGVGSGKDTQVISIVGVGGVGKTTLARVAFNDPEVDGHFALKGWVSISQSFNASLDIARAILEALGEKLDDARNLETLVRRIKMAVNNKRFLLVLDNVWVDDRIKWEEIKKCLHGGKGSRIIVTTRDESVARIMGTDKRQSLDLLSHEDCGTILNRVALEGSSREDREKLRGIGMEIAKKCKGLPLAAKSVGKMLLLGSFTVQEWRDVLQSPVWTNGEEESEVFSSLNLSYTDLSPELKHCFLSSVFFPKGTEIRIHEMVRIWMAYGYLNSNDGVEEVQLKGCQHLNNLTMRSFFQIFESDYNAMKSFYQIFESGYNDKVLYRMHDILHDFATYLTGSDGYSFIWDGGLDKGKSSSSFHYNLPPPNSLGRLRTFSVCREELRPGIASHLTSVRVLSMRGCNLEGLPKDIGKLIHLRYLNVSDNPITELPETITGLCNLQTLDIGRCMRLSSLPEGIEKLTRLRHLVNTDTFKLVEFPHGLEKLSGLWTLSEYRGSNLGCLGSLNQLQGSVLLYVKNLNKGEAGNANLIKKEHIKALELFFCEEAGEVDQVVKALEPPPKLLTLVISSTSGNWLSHWIPSSSFKNLKKVCFNGHRKCSVVPPFCKLPSLEVLEIMTCSFKLLSNEFLGLEDVVVGGFPKLKKLRFRGCYVWKEWKDIKEDEAGPIMKCLEELEIDGCWSLQELPPTLLRKATSLQVVKLWGNTNIRLPPSRTWTVITGSFDAASFEMLQSVLGNLLPPPLVFNPLARLRRARRRRPTPAPDTKVSTSESQ